MEYVGEIAGVVTAISWTATALFFQVASRRIGSLVVNLLRLVLAALFYMVYTKIAHGYFFPQADLHAWTYLSVSAIIGFVLGDFFLFKSYEYISARKSMLIFSVAPPISAVCSWFMLDERLTVMNVVGMMVVLSGVCLVILFGKHEDEKAKAHAKRGVLYALLGALGQGVGSVFSKIGMGDYDPFVASQIRVLVGIIGFLIVITGMRRWPLVRQSFSDLKGLGFTTLGAFFGPFLGVGLAMVSFKYIPVGIASTLMSTMPVFILAPAFFFFKEKITLREVIGAVVAVAGVLIFFVV